MSTEQSGGSKLSLVIILLVGAVLVANLSKGIVDLLAVRNRVVEAEGQVSRLEQQKQALEQQYARHTAMGYIEQEIREKLGLSRPGEVVVLLPGQTSTPAAVAATPTVLARERLPIWQQWMSVLGL